MGSSKKTSVELGVAQKGDCVRGGASLPAVEMDSLCPLAKAGGRLANWSRVADQFESRNALRMRRFAEYYSLIPEQGTSDSAELQNWRQRFMIAPVCNCNIMGWLAN